MEQMLANWGCLKSNIAIIDLKMELHIVPKENPPQLGRVLSAYQLAAFRRA